MRNQIICLMSGLMLGGMAATASGVELTPEQQRDVDEYMLGASSFIMFHEAGHLLIDQLKLPVLGREEDAADTIAAIVMLNQEGDDESRGIEYLDASVTSWFLFGESEYGEISDDSMADEHSLHRQRAFFNVCMMHGSGQTHLENYAEQHRLPAERQEKCVSEYEKALMSVSMVLAPHSLPDGAQNQTQAIISYDETEEYAEIRDLLIEEQFLEGLAEAIFGSIAMPADILFGAGECEMVNAFYGILPYEDEPTPAVIFCYEMADVLRASFTQAFYGEHAVDADEPMASLIESVDDLGLDDPDDEAERVFLEDAASFLRWPKFEVQRY